MARYSKRRRSRRGSKRKRRGGNLSALITKTSNAAHGVLNKTANRAYNVLDDASEKVKALTGKGMAEAKTAVDAAEANTSAGLSSVTSKIVPPQSGGRRGGSGRCCFPAKFCGSRKRKGNKRRSIRSGRCCLPVKSKKCGARKKNGRKTKKNKRKRKRGMFKMFGGG